MRLPISSSSKDAIISTSRRTSGSSRSISIFFFVFSTLFNTSARASVSILDKMAAAFFTSISFRYSAAFSSSVYSKISESISVSRIRYSLHRSCTVSTGSTSARSFSWKSCSLHPPFFCIKAHQKKAVCYLLHFTAISSMLFPAQ